jgi:DTW domain-containing protein YfiP
MKGSKNRRIMGREEREGVFHRESRRATLPDASAVQLGIGRLRRITPLSHRDVLLPDHRAVARFHLMRVTCYRCFWPQPLCWCESITPMATRTRFVFLMHPKEFKQEKAATGRLTHLCLKHSDLFMGIGFDEHPEVQSIIADPQNIPVLLHPGRDAIDLSATTFDAADGPLQMLSQSLRHRTLVVFLIDATWALGRKMLRLSASLQRLPRIMFSPSAPSRYVIKQQPHSGCLSTLEATHELLLALRHAGLDEYPLPDQLLGLFDRMQDFQLKCAADPNRTGYRRHPYKPPAERVALKGRSASRRASLFQTPKDRTATN